MSPENQTPNQDDNLFTASAEDFFTKYRPLTKEELVELGESPITTLSVSEEIIAKQEAFLKNTFETWDKNTAPKAKINTEMRLPSDQDWSALEKDIDPDKFGELILNPETQNIDFETAKVFIPDLSAFNGKKLSEVAEHLITAYGDKYYLPGIEYEEWIFNKANLGALPSGSEFETLKTNLNDNYCFFFGSTLRDSGGPCGVPYLRWSGSSWNRFACWLGISWNSLYRVVLLER